MTYNVFSGTLNPTHSHSLTCEAHALNWCESTERWVLMVCCWRCPVEKTRWAQTLRRRSSLPTWLTTCWTSVTFVTCTLQCGRRAVVMLITAVSWPSSLIHSQLSACLRSMTTDYSLPECPSWLLSRLIFTLVVVIFCMQLMCALCIHASVHYLYMLMCSDALLSPEMSNEAKWLRPRPDGWGQTSQISELNYAP